MTSTENQLLREALQGMLNIVNDSRGVAGYHMNGEIAEWDEFEEVDNACAAISHPAQPAETAEVLFAAFGDGPTDDQCKDLWLRYPSLREWHKRTFTTPPAEGGEAVRDADRRLMTFYGVDGLHALIDAQDKHIARLQAKLPRNDQPVFTRVREG
jgi:uncharacterized small protein (DUF1192 family)